MCPGLKGKIKRKLQICCVMVITTYSFFLIVTPFIEAFSWCLCLGFWDILTNLNVRVKRQTHTYVSISGGSYY